MQISSCDNVGSRSESGALYHTGFDSGDSRQLASISRAMSVGEKVSHPVVDIYCRVVASSGVLLKMEVGIRKGVWRRV